MRVAAAAVFLCGCGGDGGQSEPTAVLPARPMAHVISYGQSLSIGEHSTSDYPGHTVPPDPTDVGYMFAGGTRPEDLSRLVLFHETNRMDTWQIWNSDLSGETPLYGALSQLQTLDVNLLGSTAGRGGTAIADLSQGSAPYARVIDQVTAGMALSNGPYSVLGIIWMQGDSDSGNTGYAGEFEQLVMDLDHDIRAITGQAAPIQFYVCLPSVAHDIGQAQAQVSQVMLQVHIVCDTTSFPRVSDNVHLTVESEREVGQALGQAMLAQAAGQ
jgi:hypothetical protein